MSGTNNEKALAEHRVNRGFKRRFVTNVKTAFKRARGFLKEWMKDPNALPTYCFEYAPDC